MSTELNIGVIGYSAQDFNESEARDALKKLLDDIKSNNPDKNYTIVSGLTNLGVPKLAYEVATQQGLKTVGIACSKAREFETFDVDEEIIHGSEWGDESEEFLSYVDVIIKIGGGSQSEEEAKKAEQQGIPVLSYKL